MKEIKKYRIEGLTFILTVLVIVVYNIVLYGKPQQKVTCFGEV